MCTGVEIFLRYVFSTQRQGSSSCQGSTSGCVQTGHQSGPHCICGKGERPHTQKAYSLQMCMDQTTYKLSADEVSFLFSSTQVLIPCMLRKLTLVKKVRSPMLCGII